MFLHWCAFAARAHKLHVGPTTEGEAQRLDQDRFARAGFTRKHGQAALEFDVDRADDDQILNRQRFQQGSRPQFNLALKVAK